MRRVVEQNGPDQESSAQAGAESAVRQFKRLVEHIPGLVVYMDLVQPDNPGSSTPLYISPQIEELLGYPYAAWLTDDEIWLDVLHPDDRERMVAADAEARRTLSSLFAEYRMVHRDGHVVWVSEKAAVVQDDVTDAMYWQGVMVDITDRKLVESALATSERQFRSIFDAAAIGVMTIGLDGGILEANPTLEQICEYPSGALHGKLLVDYLEPADRSSMERFGELAAGDSDRCHLEHLFRRNDRSLMWCRTVMALVRDDEGRPAHVTAMLEDISDRKLVEADLVHRTLHDPLTELPNRQYFLDRLRQTRARRFSAGDGVAVVFMDLDGFKDVNDSQGHQAGDELLLAVARRLREAVRPVRHGRPLRRRRVRRARGRGRVADRRDAARLAADEHPARPVRDRRCDRRRDGQHRRRLQRGPGRRGRGHHPQGRRDDVPGEAARAKPGRGVRRH